MGSTIGVAFAPQRWPTWRKGLLVAAYGVLACGPDIAFKFLRGINRGYSIAHSLPLNALVMGTLILTSGLWRGARRRLGGWVVLAGAVVAEFSHLLLDAMYKHGKGVGIFWPFSDATLNLSLPWFDTLPAGPNYWQRAARIWSIELAFWGGLLVLVLAVRACVVRVAKRRQSALSGLSRTSPGRP